MRAERILEEEESSRGAWRTYGVAGALLLGLGGLVLLKFWILARMLSAYFS